MSHSRDMKVLHTVDRRVFLEIPLYDAEDRMKVREVVIEKHRMLVICEKPEDRPKS